MSKEIFSERWKMALMAITLWVFLAAWTLSAFWEHIKLLQPEYPLGSQFGAAASEVAILFLIVLHCFSKHIGVRKVALIFAAILSGLVVIHSSALRGHKESMVAQVSAEQRMAEQLGRMSAEQARAIEADQFGTQRERLAKNRAALAQKAEIAKAAQDQVAREIAGGAEKIKKDSIIPQWYWDGGMYSLLFIVSVLFLSVCFGLMMRDDVDANFDGVPDRQQIGYKPSSTSFVTVAQPAGKGSTDPKA